MKEKKAYFAGGCFWGFEELFRKQEGVLDTDVGYMGGLNNEPTYRDHSGHAEAIEIIYDTDKTSYKLLLDYFFRIHDPTTKDRQGNDTGSSYRSAIFYQNEEELQETKDFIKIVNNSGRWVSPVVTTLEPYVAFWKAESYHQDYLQENPNGYTCHYERGSSYLEK